jgi:hypothetical protein
VERAGNLEFTRLLDFELRDALQNDPLQLGDGSGIENGVELLLHLKQRATKDFNCFSGRTRKHDTQSNGCRLIAKGCLINQVRRRGCGAVQLSRSLRCSRTFFGREVLNDFESADAGKKQALERGRRGLIDKRVRTLEVLQ